MKNTSKKKLNLESSKVLGLCHYKVNYILNLSDYDIKKYGIPNLDEVESLNDLPFLLEDKTIWNRFEIQTENEELNTFLYMNKCLDSNKIQLELISFELKKLDQSIYYEMINSINLNYNITVNETSLNDSEETINIIIKNGEKEKSFEIQADQDAEYKEPESEAQKKSNDNNTNTKAKMKSKMNIKKERKEKAKEEEKEEKETIFDKITLYNENYDYFICFYNDFKDIDPIDDFIDFLSTLKNQYNTNIIIFYSDTTDKFSEEESIKQINKIYLLTDTFILDCKDAISNFNKHYQSFRGKNKKEEKEMTEKDINDYFIHTIACGGNLSLQNSKVCFMLDDKFKKITILEVPMGNKGTNLNYEIKPYPKINKNNIDFVQKYKDEIKNNRDKYKNLFFAGLLSKFCQSKNKVKGISDLYPSFLFGCELIKRCLDLKVNEYDSEVNPKFYIIKLNKDDIENYIKKVEDAKIENQFILDCTNKSKSKMKYYVPLFDKNLYEYFGNKPIKKELTKKGFINEKGFINYDPLYREGMGVQKKNNKIKKSKEVVLKQIKENEENNSERIIRHSSPTKKRIPDVNKNNYEETLKKSKSNKRYKNRSVDLKKEEEEEKV